VDAVTLDHLLGEIRPLVVGRYLSRPRLCGASALALETSGLREQCLWLDAGRTTAGIYLVARDGCRGTKDDSSLPGPARAFLLHARKHVGGARVSSLGRIPGTRSVVLEAGPSSLVLRLAGSSASLVLVRDAAALARLGDGTSAWPLEPPAPEREWDRVPPLAFEQDVAAALAAGRPLARAVAGACPGLGPVLARELDGTAGSLLALRARLAAPTPTVLAPPGASPWPDVDLAPPGAVLLAPLSLERPGRRAITLPTWRAAAALFLQARRRGDAFERGQRTALAEVRRELRRLERLAAHLENDGRGLPDEQALRRDAEALLAYGSRLEAGSSRAELEDPYEPGQRRLVAIDARLDGLGNAQRLFDRARRVERARQQLARRGREVRSSLEQAHRLEASVLAARELADLGPAGASGAGGEPRGAESLRPRHYLTSRGLSLLAGRSAKENHHLTFRVAQPEDLWLHARDHPGAHVILLDREGRAQAADLREAAEVAAFFSEGHRDALVDVHVTRRKHVRPARGAPGRVNVSHSETLRVAPRDPEGRLRRR
jgi:hypothetical protein